MADERAHPMLILQMDQASVTARAMDALHHATESGNHERHGAIGDAQYHLRWLRPTLIFPPDAPDAVRLGLTIEGGVVLATGRILSVDAFLTATAPPDLVQRSGRLVAQLPLTDLPNGTLHLSYAGQTLPPAPVRPAQGLPTDDEIDTLLDGLRSTIADWLGALPPLPLSPPLPTTQASATRIAPEGTGAAFALCFPEDAADAPAPLSLDFANNTAILLNSSAVAGAFTAAQPQIDPLLGKSWHVTAMAATTQHDRLACTIQARQANATGATFTARFTAAPYVVDGSVRLTIADVTVDQLVGQEAVGERLIAAIAAPGFVRGFAATLSGAITRATANICGAPTEHLAWQWDAGEMPRPFTTTTLTVNDGWLVIAGIIPSTSSGEDLPELLAVDLHVGGTVEPLDGGQVMRVTVVAAPLTPVTLPSDCAWWNAATSQTLLLEHTASLAVEMRIAEDDPSDTVPRYLRTRPLPIGLTTVRSALIDAFGRVALAEQEIDLRELPVDAPATINLAAAAAMPTSVTSAKTIVTPRGTQLTPISPTLSEIPTRAATAYTPAIRQEQARSSLMGMLAGGLAVFAIFAIIAAVILTRTVQAQGATPQPTATAIIAVTTPSPQITVTPHGGKTPTPVPNNFGIFSPSSTNLTFTCNGGHADPQPLTLTNSGKAPIKWKVNVHGMVTQGTTVQSWAMVTPESGSLEAGQSVPLTVAVPDAFCAQGNSDQNLMQFTATSGSAVPVTVHGTHT